MRHRVLVLVQDFIKPDNGRDKEQVTTRYELGEPTVTKKRWKLWVVSWVVRQEVLQSESVGSRSGLRAF